MKQQLPIWGTSNHNELQCNYCNTQLSTSHELMAHLQTCQAREMWFELQQQHAIRWTEWAMAHREELK